MICLLYDRHSSRGGDHFYGLGRSLREVCMLDGMMNTVPDAKWTEFGRKQVDLLVEAGWTHEKALGYYPNIRLEK